VAGAYRDVVAPLQPHDAGARATNPSSPDLNEE